MSRTKINVSAVIDASRHINSAKTYVSSAKSSFTQTKNGIDGKIQNRSNIRDRLSTVQRQLSNIDSKIGRIRSTVQSGANQYRSTDDKVESWKRDINNKIGTRTVSATTGVWSQYFKTTPEKVNSKTENRATNDYTGKGIKIQAKALKFISELIKNKDKSSSNKLAITSSGMSYLSGLYTFLTNDYSDGTDLISGCLKFSQSSTSMWNGTYKYLEKSLNPTQAAKFGKRFQGKVGVVSLVGNVCGFSADSINSIKVLMNQNSTDTEKIHSLLNSTDSGLDVAQSAVNLKYGQKVLTRTVTAKYNWGVAAKNVTKLDNATACVSILGVTVDSMKGFNLKHGEVTADGSLSAGDMGEIGISTSIHGLTSVVGKATFGLSDVLGLSDKADEMTEGIINFADTTGAEFVRNHEYSSNYVKNAQFLMDYADNEENNIVKRVAAASTAGIGMIGAVTVDCVGEGVRWMGNELNREWNLIKNFFS